VKPLHHFRKPGTDRAFCGAELRKPYGEPVKPPANICAECDVKWREYRAGREDDRKPGR
jgi:hypothetical protein